LVNEEIRRGREKGEKDRVNLFLIHPCVNNGMGKWEGIILSVPAYTTKKQRLLLLYTIRDMWREMGGGRGQEVNISRY
jgi:hypothetical protein